MKSLQSTLACLVLLCSCALDSLAQSPPGSAPQAATGTPIQARLQEFVDQQMIAGAVALLARTDEVLALETVGAAALSRKQPMRVDNLFWVASMTKPMAAVAVLMLEEEGLLSTDDPVEKHLPEFKDQWLLAERSENRQVLVPAPRPITLRDLLTHTSGLNDLRAPRPDCSLAELAMAYSQKPLLFPPGDRWAYCNSGINTLGRVVEVVSGKKFEEFLQTRLFDPLEMVDTTFWPSEAQAQRLAASYRQSGSDGGLEETSIFLLQSGLTDRSRTPFPAGGLFSTAPDMARFYQMLLRGGEWNGQRLLSRRAVREMTSTHTGDLRTGFTPGMSWGLGFQVVREPQGVTAMLSRGSFGHGGAYGTQSWADPERDLIFILMIQRAGLPNADGSPVRQAFQEAAAAWAAAPGSR